MGIDRRNFILASTKQVGVKKHQWLSARIPEFQFKCMNFLCRLNTLHISYPSLARHTTDMDKSIPDIPSSALESLNDSFELLGLVGLKDCLSSTSAFLLACNELLTELRKFDDKVLAVKVETINEVYSIISHRSPYFNVDSDKIEYKIISYLVSEVQAEQLYHIHQQKVVKNLPANEEFSHGMPMDVDISTSDNSYRGKIMFLLEKIINELKIDVSNANNEHEMISSIIDYIQLLPVSYDSNNSIMPIFDANNLNLTSESYSLLHKINESFYQDFGLRRKMLLKRLEVTVKSFLWSENVEKKEDEVLSIINDQLQYLNEFNNKHTIEEALHAPLSLPFEHSKRVSALNINDQQKLSSGNKIKSKSIVKQIIIGKVPDRGGRVNEMRPKHTEGGGNKYNKQYNNNNNQSKKEGNKKRKSDS
eukprot:gene5668-7825_t